MNRYLGKLVMVISTSSGPSSCCASSLRYRMFASTMLKWARSPPYGFPGVPSIMYDPYSGLHSDLTLLQEEKQNIIHIYTYIYIQCIYVYYTCIYICYLAFEKKNDSISKNFTNLYRIIVIILQLNYNKSITKNRFC